MAKNAKGGIFLRQVLAENLRTYRKNKALSQEEMASKCKLHRTYIGSVERCERNVTLSTLETLADTLGVTVPELLTKQENDNELRPEYSK